MPSIGFEPMTFPMSRERATPAPTGHKSIEYLFIIAKKYRRGEPMVFIPNSCGIFRESFPAVFSFHGGWQAEDFFLVREIPELFSWSTQTSLFVELLLSRSAW